MSPDSFKPVKSGRWRNGEDESERRLANPVENGRDLNNCSCAQHHDGVGGRGMPVQVVRLKVEVCDGGPEGSNARTSAQSARRAQAAAEVGAAHSSEEGGNDAGAKGPCLNEANREGKDEVMARTGGIVTPQKVRELQRRPCRKTKENKRWRACTLYGELTRQDILETTAKTVVRNAGAAGPDGQTTMQLKANMDATLKTLRDEPREHRCKPGAVKRVWIPKAGGKRRPLGIPNVRDRVVQTALLLLLEPIFEAVFNEHSHAYRPKRSAQDALNAIREALRRGQTEVMDADLSAYFDTINHAALLKLVARKVSDGSILGLLKAMLRAPVIEPTQRGTRIQAKRTGTPQGGVISPLLANLYLNSLDHAVNENPAHDAKLIRYADDFVLMCRPGKSGPLYERLKRYLEAKKLKLNETKTRVVDSRREKFSFPGFELSNRRSVRKGTRYVHVEAARKARRKLRETIRRKLNRWTIHESCAQAVRTVTQSCGAGRTTTTTGDTARECSVRSKTG